MVYRVVIGIILSIVYLLAFTGVTGWFEGFNHAQKAIFNNETVSIAKAMSGIIYIYLMAIASVYFIVFSDEAHKIFIGVFLIPIVFAVMQAF